ncbi:hypothetical protein [Streptomyces sp. AC495_CC817]|uniref:hypothetical protein n=1 Tax=Streptomyces sp. AC495_CC817 TaxID=2823900 RepID=UPI001C27A134|nr:hypothetical protein [Streptomyces sp. AC495_CC817]
MRHTAATLHHPGAFLLGPMFRLIPCSRLPLIQLDVFLVVRQYLMPAIPPDPPPSLPPARPGLL